MINAGVFRNLLIAFVCVGGLWAPAPATAELPRDLLTEFGVRSFNSSQERDVASLQTDLAWLGLFQDRIDGQMNRSTRLAVDSFLDSLGQNTRRSLSDVDRRELRNRAAQTIRAAGFRDLEFEWTGTSARLPSNFLRRPEIYGEDFTNIWISGKGSAGLEIQFLRYDLDGSVRPRDWLDALADVSAEEDDKLDEINRGIHGSIVFLSYRKNGKIIHKIHEIRGRKVRGLTVSFDETSRYSIQPILVEILRSVDLHAGPAVPISQISSRIRSGDYPGGRELPDWFRSMVGSGSGSIVSFDGHILTNHHVVAGCVRLTVNGQEARLLGSDFRLDLALVQSDLFSGRTPVKFRSDSVGLGETVFVMGYPVFDVSQSVNVTNGIVSSTVGLKGDRSHIQITAPVQPGNSGGPVLDQHGSQIAVVVSKVSSTLQIRRNIENIAWVIRSREALEFMNRFGISPIETNKSTSSLRPVEERVATWRQQTVRVECHRS